MRKNLPTVLLGKHCRLHGKIKLKGNRRASSSHALFCLTGCLRFPDLAGFYVFLLLEDRFAINCDTAVRASHAFLSVFSVRLAGHHRVLIAVLLHPGRTEASQTEPVDGMLPGEEFLHRQRIALAGIIQAEQATAHRSDHFGLATDDPAAR